MIDFDVWLPIIFRKSGFFQFELEHLKSGDDHKRYQVIYISIFLQKSHQIVQTEKKHIPLFF